MESSVVKLDEQTYRILKDIKEKDGVPMTQTIKRAVAEFIKKKGV